MAVTELNAQDFTEQVKNSALPVLVDFWAPWCGPCTIFAPTIEKIAEEYEGKLNVCKLNIDQAPDIASRYGIMSIPTVILFRNGEEVERMTGAVSAEAIKAKIAAHVE